MYSIQGKKRSNSRTFSKIIANFETKEDVKRYLEDNNIRVEGTPYVFTHIFLSDGNIITCSVRDIICSPEELYNFLINK